MFFYVFIQTRPSFENLVGKIRESDLTYLSFIFENKNLKQEVYDRAKNKN